MPWVEKYRPATLDDVVAHGDIISTSASRRGELGRRELTPPRSRPVHRQEPRTAPPLLWTSWDWQDEYDTGGGEEDLWGLGGAQEQLLGGEWSCGSWWEDNS